MDGNSWVPDEGESHPVPEEVVELRAFGVDLWESVCGIYQLPCNSESAFHQEAFHLFSRSDQSPQLI